ncbi:MAG: RNA polymerase sigma factor [Nannocystales bacterium]
MSRFDRLYKENFRFVWAAAQRCGAPANSVEDVVQDVFVTAHRRIDELHWEVSPRGWLYGVTRRVAFRYRRTAARVARRRSTLAAAARPAAQPHARTEAALVLDKLLERLDGTQRDVFVMTELLGMSSPEIAAELSLPLNTVYSRLRLARARMTKLAGSSPALDHQLGSTKAALQPTQSQARRTRAALIPLLGTATTKLSPGIAGALKLATVPALALTVVGIGYLSGTEPSPAHPRPEVHVAGVATTPASPTLPAPRSPTVPSQQADRAGLGSSTVVPRDMGSTRSEAASRKHSSMPPEPRSPGTRPVPATVAGSTGLGTSNLAEEVALLDAAKDLLYVGAHADALAKLQEHARRFPQGQLGDARLAALVAVQCAAGQSVAAEETARELHNRFPRSSISRNTPKRCATP